MRLHRFLPSSLALVVASLASSPASAGIEACGDIEVDASAKCEVLVGGGCTAQCEPLSFTAACYAECDGECSVAADVECTASCEGECSGSCEANPGSYDCEAGCEAECDGSCDAHCSASEDQAQCQASCQATCSGECGASCEGTPPSASCEAKCEASCSGSCQAEVNIDCQVDCQGGCTVQMQGGCEVECSKPEGALFCDGQFVDHGGNLQECIDALNAWLTAHVDVSASGSASCEGGSCEAEGEVGISCALAAAPSAGGSGWFAGLGALVTLGGLGLRRRVRG